MHFCIDAEICVNLLDYFFRKCLSDTYFRCKSIILVSYADIFEIWVILKLTCAVLNKNMQLNNVDCV